MCAVPSRNTYDVFIFVIHVIRLLASAWLHFISYINIHVHIYIFFSYYFKNANAIEKEKSKYWKIIAFFRHWQLEITFNRVNRPSTTTLQLIYAYVADQCTIFGAKYSTVDQKSKMSITSITPQFYTKFIWLSWHVHVQLLQPR